MEVGQVVYLRPVGNQARYSKEIQQGEITKIGRKYFYVKISYDEIQFCIQNNLQKNTGYGYGRDWDLYFSEQEIFDENEYLQLLGSIQKFFREYQPKVSLEQLRKIASILNI